MKAEVPEDGQVPHTDLVRNVGEARASDCDGLEVCVLLKHSWLQREAVITATLHFEVF